ncbi:MAG: chromosome segregation protein SMC [Clostridia bacterium]
MILKALEMQGFKSFPEKTTLTFGKGMTAVVGPNGSGKSNISDAIRWVLGEQSNKSIRASKMEDVIFDGTKVRKSHGFAIVTLKLDNTDRTITSIDSDEISVSRRYFRSGESEYKINGSSVRLRDIHELFMDTGLGRDGYSMVSQGKIAEMISDKNQECREMLEEAAGISSYRYRRTDSLKKLNQAEDNLVRLRDILLELEGRIGPLKKDSEKAEKFIVYAGEKKDVEISLWLHNIDKLRDNLRDQENKLIIAQTQYNDIEQYLSEVAEQIDSSILQNQDINIKIDEIRKEISDTDLNASNIDSQVAVLESSIEHNKDTIDRILKDKNASAQDQDDLQKEIFTLEKLILLLKNSIKSKQEDLDELQSELGESKTIAQNLDGELAEKMTQIAAQTRQLSEIRIESSTANSSMEEINGRVEIIDQLISLRQDNVLEHEAELEQIDVAYTECKDEIRKLETEIQEKTQKLNEKFVSLDKYTKDYDNTNFEYQRLNSKVKMLEDLQKNMEGYSGAVKKVVSSAKNNQLSGICGTVSQVITVKPAHSLAIETALSNAVQNIITKTQDDAKKAIEYLKKINAGRATFQPINSIKGRTLQENGLNACHGFIDTADNLVECDDEYKQIILSLLGRIVIVDDLTNAIAMANKFSKRFKIVTLDGQVINAGGAMTGGSQGRNVGILSRSAEIDKLKLKGKKLQEQMQDLESMAAKAEEEHDWLKRNTEDKKQELLQKGQEKIRLEGEQNLATQQLISAQKAHDELVQEKNSADERIANILKVTQNASERIEKLNAQITQNEDRVEEINDQKFEYGETNEHLNKNITELNLEIQLSAKDMAAKTQAINLLKSNLVNHEYKDRELEQEVEKINQKSEDTKNEIQELKVLKIKLYDDKKQMEQDIINLQSQRSDFESKSNKLRQSEREKTLEREKISGELARLEERKNTMQIEYDSTINKLYDEYQLSLREAGEAYERTSEPAAAQKMLKELKAKIKALGSVNLGAIEEYKEVGERYEFLSTQIDDVEKSKRELTKLIHELTEKMSTKFSEQFEKINANFSETFKELFGGGDARLVLENPDEVLQSNIEIKLQPPGKNVKRLDALSGGEKGLSAIALLFAIMQNSPSPFCIFDEVEAALDDVNVSRYAQYVRRLADDTQFILITHRRGTMEEADMLYGITMQEKGVSKLVELNTSDLSRKLGITN